ncbi:uncharacterized protein MONBRDRAFT_36915 [Monosiga brevicollis MX1]|uniref:Uncharacterized protein n=1 Tax=Monosiga brevicollis TaxID=81824 RepID=A9UYD2_MONBE|nr:uncharacterized protein MONBRDRAFT_36915 [Monosiga brevicollis MX1]EDQ89584.1 predicted protein [Monosiga brevicollis MX1]|eukprot:XP_001745613.1 hypothetical protein [Monosiga brevicollis MX1]
MQHTDLFTRQRRAAALRIQACWRCHVARHRYQQIQHAVRLLQRQCRRWMAQQRWKQRQKASQEAPAATVGTVTPLKAGTSDSETVSWPAPEQPGAGGWSWEGANTSSITKETVAKTPRSGTAAPAPSRIVFKATVAPATNATATASQPTPALSGSAAVTPAAAPSSTRARPGMQELEQKRERLAELRARRMALQKRIRERSGQTTGVHADAPDGSSGSNGCLRGSHSGSQVSGRGGASSRSHRNADVVVARALARETMFNTTRNAGYQYTKLIRGNDAQPSFADLGEAMAGLDVSPLATERSRRVQFAETRSQMVLEFADQDAPSRIGSKKRLLYHGATSSAGRSERRKSLLRTPGNFVLADLTQQTVLINPPGSRQRRGSKVVVPAHELLSASGRKDAQRCA